MSSRLGAKLLLFRQFFSSIRRRGFRRTLQIGLLEFWYERKLSADTAYIISKDRLDMDADARAHSSDYFPSGYLILREALVGGPIDPRDKVFVDYGCGMGRALLFASTLPLKRIIGVELSPSLCAAAATNMTRHYAASVKRLPDWSVVNVDARSFAVPDEASIFYFFNPFDATVMATVMDNINASLRKAPRQVFLVYAKPVHGDIMVARGAVRLPSISADVAIYSLGAAAPGRAR